MFKAEGDGLSQFGHGKDRRLDLPQVKVMLSALDSLLVIRSLQHAKRAERSQNSRKNPLRMSEP